LSVLFTPRDDIIHLETGSRVSNEDLVSTVNLLQIVFTFELYDLNYKSYSLYI